jgi:hypothetical protein
VRIAISGSHLVGKSTLAEELGARLAGHRVVDEPYRVLEDEGYEFPDQLDVDDFVVQLRCSLRLLASRRRDVIFDRCPLDFLGYILALPGGRAFDLHPWLTVIETRLATLDLLVFVPVGSGTDSIPPPPDNHFRLAVDGVLRDLVLADELGVCGDLDVVEVTGSAGRRVSEVMRRISLA